MNILEEVTNILDLLYKHGWDERNGGNLSMLLSEREVLEVVKEIKITKTFHYDFDLGELINKYFIITATSSYFKNMKSDPSSNLGILKVIDKNTLGLVWGYTNGGKPTSEAPTHLKSHIERLKVDANSRVIIHCHPTNLIAMTHLVPISNKKYTEILWKMQTESIVVFPEGVSILPWMVCGGEEIAIETAKLMKEYRSVIWTAHGIFASGNSLDETFGLIETIEKAAIIYLKICDKKYFNVINNDNLIELAKAFNVNYRHGIID